MSAPVRTGLVDGDAVRRPESPPSAAHPQSMRLSGLDSARLTGLRISGGSSSGGWSAETRIDLSDLRDRVREKLLAASAGIARADATEGMPGPTAEGRMNRGLLALAGCSDPAAPPPGFWSGVLAIQLAHEASLIHDDVIDGADVRHGRSSVVARSGIAGALLRGDHLLTAAYRAAAMVGSLEFAALLARSVERTVAAEVEQSECLGRALDPLRSTSIALGKAGELMGCALALAPILEGRKDVTPLFELGRRIGLLYQRVDDLLDYCPGAVTGKPALGDFAQRRWTWVLEEFHGLPFSETAEALLSLIHGPVAGAGDSPAQRCLHRLRTEGECLCNEAAVLLPGHRVTSTLITEWLDRVSTAVTAERRIRTRRDRFDRLRRRFADIQDCRSYLAAHSHTFRFATRFFPRRDAERVTRVYTFCRFTDDLVDQPEDGEAEATLDAWLTLVQEAYRGAESGIPLVDEIMIEMAKAGVPFGYAASLVEGMRMDVRGRRYDSIDDLRQYTYCVASVVGLWLTRLFGVDEPRLLARAERLGHAMQLTNIVRDVGEDWSRGRLYLPRDLLDHHGISTADLEAMWWGAPLREGYQSIVEALIQEAEDDYAAALSVVPQLPVTFGRPVAVAACLYRGIHREIRQNRYDNLRRRAYTSRTRKCLLSAGALLYLGLARAGGADG